MCSQANNRRHSRRGSERFAGEIPMNCHGVLSQSATELLQHYLQAHFRRIGITVGSIVLLIVYLSLGLTRGSGAIISIR